MMRHRTCCLWLFTFVLSTLAGASALSAQSAAPLLPPGHWVRAALRRVESLAPSAPVSDLFGGNLTHVEAAEQLRKFSTEGSPGSRAIAASYLDLLEREFKDLAERKPGLSQIAATVGATAGDGLAAPGNGFIRGEDWTGARVLDDRDGVIAGATAAATSRYFGAQLIANYDVDELKLHGSHAVGRVKRISLWGGNRRLGFAGEDGIVLSGMADFTGGGVYLNRPITFPWIFRYLGPFRFETMMSQLDSSGIVQDPLFWAARGSIQPLPNIILGLNRAAIFGGEGNGGSLADVLEMIVGGYGGDAGEFENQVVSADARIVVQSENQPVEVYGEWASDDGSGMWYKAPAIRAGLLLPTLRAYRNGYVGIEGTVFFPKPDCCNTYWYRNTFFRGSWSSGDVLLGHPLGGHGREVKLIAGTDEHYAKLRVRSQLFLRERGAENTFSPEREGNSFGAAVSILLRVRQFEIGLNGDLENGDGWNSNRLVARVHAFF